MEQSIKREKKIIRIWGFKILPKIKKKIDTNIIKKSYVPKGINLSVNTIIKEKTMHKYLVEPRILVSR